MSAQDVCMTAPLMLDDTPSLHLPCTAAAAAASSYITTAFIMDAILTAARRGGRGGREVEGGRILVRKHRRRGEGREREQKRRKGRDAVQKKKRKRGRKLQDRKAEKEPHFTEIKRQSGDDEITSCRL